MSCTTGRGIGPAYEDKIARRGIILASLASADLLTAVEVPAIGSGGPADVANLEMGVVDVERVLGWLETQRRLPPERVEVRREASVAYLLLIYDSPEPPGLFPS